MVQKFTHSGNWLLIKQAFLFGFLTFFSLGLSAQITINVTETDVACFGDCTGSATVTATGGTTPYTYFWNTGATTATASGLCGSPGGTTYDVTVTDANGVTAVEWAHIFSPTQMTVTAFGSSQICDLAPDGTATAVPSGGTAPYTYTWSNGGTTAQITGLAAGTYTVTATDANGCTAAASATVDFWNEGIWLMDSSTNISCFGLTDGFIHIGVMSGTPPYTYSWNTGANTADLFNLSAGTYNVTVTDANGCTNQWSVTLTAPPAISLSTTSNNASCGNTGSATVTASGGVGGYTYAWSNGSTNSTISNLAAGTYSVTVTDANGCSNSTSVTVSSSGGNLSVSAMNTGNATCNTGGSATANATGGANYSFMWSNGANTQSVTGLNAGTYTVTVVDGNSGCTGTASVTITQTAGPSVSVVKNADASCLTGGSATATGSGSTAPYTYVWSNGATGATASNLPAGMATVTVTDAGGCTATGSVTIGQSSGPSVTATANTPAGCSSNGSATASASGGTQPYTYLWDNGENTATATNLTAGAHSVTVTDAAGCADVAMVTIMMQGSTVNVSTTATNAGCTVFGSATASASGGTAPYSYVWSNGGNTATISNLNAGSYTVTATDASGCSGTSTVSVQGTPMLMVSITSSSNATCDQKGSATATAFGGSGTITYAWDNGETTATATMLQQGIHTVTVTDAAGCTATTDVNIGLTNNGIKVGDFVWFDNDQDGFQDPNVSNGAPNVTVELFKVGPDGIACTADDIAVGTQTTDGNGMYMFDCITPGQYYIKFSNIPNNYQFSPKDAVNNDCKDSDADADGKTSVFTIVPGQTDQLCIDAGIHEACQNITDAGIVAASQTVCEGETPAMLYNVQFPTGGSGPIQYLWLRLVQNPNGGTTWDAVPGGTQANLNLGPHFVTTYYMRCARRAGCQTFLESNILTIKVLPAGHPDCQSFLKNFNASVTQAKTVMVKWTVRPEVNEYDYFVERSENAVTWSQIGMVHGLQNNNGDTDYEFMDNTPNAGMNWYRIRRMDGNNVEVTSSAISLTVDFTLEESLSIKPTLVDDIIFINNIQKYDGDVTIEMVSMSGQVLHTLNIPADTYMSIELPLADVAPGVYAMRVRFADGSTKTVKVLKY